MTVDMIIPDPSLGLVGQAVSRWRGPRVRTGRAFAQQVELFKEHVLKTADMLHKRKCAEMFTAFVREAPVGDPSYWRSPPAHDYRPGHFRYNCRVALATDEVRERDGVDPVGRMTLAEGLAFIAAAPRFARMRITNKTPYAARLARGWSRQAKDGWIERIVARVAAKYSRAK